MPSGDVDDAQAGSRERRRSVYRHAGVIRTAVSQRGDHVPCRLPVDGRAGGRHVSGNPAHQDRTRAACSNRYGSDTTPSSPDWPVVPFVAVTANCGPAVTSYDTS